MPVIATDPAASEAAYVTVQELVEELTETRVQEGLVKVPPARVADHDTVPMGELGVPALVSVTVTE